MTLFALCELIGAICPEGLEKKEIKGITSSSKRVGDSYVFVCILGYSSDGHGYIAEALERGAAAVVIEKKEYMNDKTVLCNDTRRALSVMLDALFGFPSKKMRFIGVTGTNGKTSVSVMIKNILDTAGIKSALIGTVKCSSPTGDIEKHPSDPLANMTTPDPEELYPMLASMAEAGAEFVVMETTSHALYLKKLAPIDFEVGIFTNLTQDHLDFHSSMEEYFRAKLELFKKSGVGIVNVDDFYGRRLADMKICPILTCSAKDSVGDYKIERICKMDPSGIEYILTSKERSVNVRCAVTGSFSLMNSLQAAACALTLGIDGKTVEEAFLKLGAITGRLEKVDFEEKVDFSLFIDYAHTPDALENLIKSARSFRVSGGRIVVLFGCGGDRDRGKRAKMGCIASEMADLSIITSDNSRSEDPDSIINDILCGVDKSKDFKVIKDRRLAIEYAVANARAGDIILLAGKGHEKYEINAEGRHDFDERRIAAEAVSKYYSKNREN